MTPAKQFATLALRAHLQAFDVARDMAVRVRSLSYRVPLTVRCGDRGFTYSISGWHGVV